MEFEANKKRFEPEDPRPVKLFFQDEARFGRINNIRRCWCAKGKRAEVGSQHVRQYTYAYTALCPETGESVSLVLPYADTGCMNIFLKEVNERFHDYRILMIVDGASWHTSKAIDLPESILLWKLPPYSPELNPVENLWKYIKSTKGFNNRTFRSLGMVEDALEKALQEIAHDTESVKSITLFKWLKI